MVEDATVVVAVSTADVATVNFINVVTVAAAEVATLVVVVVAAPVESFVAFAAVVVLVFVVAAVLITSYGTKKSWKNLSGSQSFAICWSFADTFPVAEDAKAVRLTNEVLKYFGAFCCRNRVTQFSTQKEAKLPQKLPNFAPK